MKVEEVLFPDPKVGKEVSYPTFEIWALQYSTTKKWCYQLYDIEAQALYMDGGYIEEDLLEPDEQTEEELKTEDISAEVPDEDLAEAKVMLDSYTQAEESGTNPPSNFR
jgi:hypothetical protein